MVITVLKATFTKSKPKVITYRDFKLFNQEKFKTDLKNSFRITKISSYHVCIAKSEIPGITCFFVDKRQVDVVSKFLTSRYENARQFRGSRKNHQFIPSGDNILMS